MSRRARLRGAILLAAASLLAACAPAEPRLQACAVAEKACQRTLFLATADLRGQLWEPWTRPPAIVVVPTEAFLDRIAAAFSGAAAARLDAWSVPLHDLGLLAPTLALSAAERAWHQTSPSFSLRSQRRIVLRDDGPAASAEAQSRALVHELVHAAQDVELAAGLLPTTTDGRMTWDALMEGEAIVYERVAGSLMRDEPPPELAAAARTSLGALRAKLADVDAPYTSLRHGVAPTLAVALLGPAFQQGGSTGLGLAIKSTTANSLSLMRAFDGLPALPVPAWGCRLTREPPGGLAVGRSDRLGALMLYGALARATGLDAAAWSAALAWRGDQIFVFDRPDHDERPATLWLVKAPGLTGTPIADALAARGAPAAFDGDLLVFAAGLTEAEVAAVRAALVCQDR
jgi:hypothetical protein